MEIIEEDVTRTLPETNIFAPENGCLEYDPFSILLGETGTFQGFFHSLFNFGGGKLSVPWMRSLTGFGDSPAQLRAHHC